MIHCVHAESDVPTGVMIKTQKKLLAKRTSDCAHVQITSLPLGFVPCENSLFIHCFQVNTTLLQSGGV